MSKSAIVIVICFLMSGCAGQPELLLLSKEERQAKINAEGAIKFSTVRKALENNPQWAMKELVICENGKPTGSHIKQIYCRTIELANYEGTRTREIMGM